MSVPSQHQSQNQENLLFDTIYTEYREKIIRSYLETENSLQNSPKKKTLTQKRPADQQKISKSQIISPVPSLEKIKFQSKNPNKQVPKKAHKTINSIQKISEREKKIPKSAKRERESILDPKFNLTGNRKKPVKPKKVRKTDKKKAQKNSQRRKSIEIQRREKVRVPRESVNSGNAVEYLLTQRRRSTQRKIQKLDDQFRNSANRFKIGKVKGVLKQEWKKMKIEGGNYIFMKNNFLIIF